MKVKLTNQYIKNPPPVPAHKTKEEHCDTALPGLLWEQRAVNHEWGSYRLRYKSEGGKTAYVTIGRSCDISLAGARKRARHLKAQIELGADPQAEAKAKKQVLTWNAFFTDHYLPHVKQHKRSWKNDLEMHNLRISAFIGNKRLNKITRSEVQRFHASLVEEDLSPATADHHLKLIRQALNLAVDWELLEANPVAKVKLFNQDNQVERYLSDEEMQRLLKVLKTDSNRVVCNVILFLLSTGARVSEALSAEWSDIDRKNRVWVIQATNSKSKKKRSVPLNDVAIGVLDALDTEGKHDRLFVGKRGPLTTINKVWFRIRSEAGLEDYRIHDLRHSYASLLVNAGHSLFEVQQALGHSDPKVTMRYAHLSKESLQRAANSASDKITEAMEAAAKA
ncbi:site-specific recombinase, phage integrase family [marine gamma proteobacterium HTCC2148]|nr:site-specific recombinase, phage integrase family [marine gamma proteobacterium HTCC2148]